MEVIIIYIRTDVNQFLYEGIKKIAVLNSKNIGKIIDVALIEYLNNHKYIFTNEEIKIYENIKKTKG